MLILSRKPNESLVIEMEGLSEPVEIFVTELNANQVRLGIQAPQGCKIWRKELLMTVQQNKQAAAPPSGIRGVASQLTRKEKKPGTPE
jgi:carbon storage regulator